MSGIVERVMPAMGSLPRLLTMDVDVEPSRICDVDGYNCNTEEKQWQR
jgi:hypothetical protein